MRVLAELVGKVIVDASGNEVGKVDDAEADLASKSVSALIAKEKVIPFDDIQAIGKYVLLKKPLADEAAEPVTARMTFS